MSDIKSVSGLHPWDWISVSGLVASQQCLVVHLGFSSQQIYDRIVTCPEGALYMSLAFFSFFFNGLGHVWVSVGQVDCFLALWRLGPSPSPGRPGADKLVCPLSVFAHAETVSCKRCLLELKLFTWFLGEKYTKEVSHHLSLILPASVRLTTSQGL